MSVRDVGLNSMTNNHRYPWKWWLKDLPAPAENAPTVFSTFACGGGSSMGYKRAGYNVLGNCEIDPKIAEVYKSNLRPKYSYVMDIREFNALDNLPDELYDLDVLDGSPPCSTFSTIGIREKAWGVEKQFAEGQKFQRLDDLFGVYMDTVAKLRPKVFVAENVIGIIQGNAKGYVNEIVKEAQELGYSIQIFMLNAAFMGVPQTRQRVFFIGNRMGYSKLELSFDEKPITFGEVRGSSSGKQMGKSVARIVSMSKKFEDGCRTTLVNNGEKWGHFAYTYCWDEKPAPTLTAGASQIRMCDRTMLTDEDVRNVSSFPQDYNFTGSRAHFICGMSVPPSMMANIAFEIKKQWLCADCVD